MFPYVCYRNAWKWFNIFYTINEIYENVNEICYTIENILLKTSKDFYMLTIIKWTFFLAALWVIALSVIIIFVPVGGLFAISLFIGIGMIVSGLLEILVFATEKSGSRSDLMLASGVLSSIFGIWIVFGSGIYVLSTVLPYAIGARIVGSAVSKIVEYKTSKSDKYKLQREILTAYDNVFITAVMFIPKERIVGVIQVIHGLWEGSLNYSELGAFFATNGFVFVTHEQRAHGSGWWLKNWRVFFKSKRHIFNYNMLLNDVETVRKMINDRYPTLDIILFGYSMGGNVAANYLIRYRQIKYKKTILVAPWFRLYDQRKRFKLGVKSIKLANILNRAKRMPLRVLSMGESRPNMYMLYQINDAGERAIVNSHKIKTKTMILSAREDTLVSNAAIYEFAKNMGTNVHIREYINEDHSLHWGINKEVIMKDMLEFCLLENKTTKN